MSPCVQRLFGFWLCSLVIVVIWYGMDCFLWCRSAHTVLFASVHALRMYRTNTKGLSLGAGDAHFSISPPPSPSLPLSPTFFSFPSLTSLFLPCTAAPSALLSFRGTNKTSLPARLCPYCYASLLLSSHRTPRRKKSFHCFLAYYSLSSALTAG